MVDLKESVAVVTGGAQGIGLGVSEALAAAGCHVLIADYNQSKLSEAGPKLRGLGRSCEELQVDVTQEESVRSMVRSVKARHGRIDILVCSAGVAANVVPSVRLSTQEWDRVLNVNLLGVFLCCREVASLMIEQESGRIVNIASLNSVSPAALTLVYNVAKAGVVSLTQTFAVELAPFGIRVNAVSPGPTETVFHDTVMPQRAATLGITREQMVEKVRAAIPLGRWGKPADIAKAVLFLASDQSDWITGQNLIVAGGLAGVAAVPPKEVVRGRPA